MEPIKGRIMIEWYSHQGKPFLFTTDLDVLKSFGLKEEKGWGITQISVGTILDIPAEGKVRVVSIYTNFQKEYLIDENVGINANGRGKNYAFNFEVTYQVERVEE